ncbi:MAG TPA: hypothetical protein V6D03_07620, partial [Candidatus Caenarcaniphilales bacterium]
VPAFTNNESHHSLIYAVSAYDVTKNYEIQIQETRSGVTKSLTRGSTPTRSTSGSLVPLHVGYDGTATI